MIPYTFTRAFALSFTERRRAKNMANQSNMQLSMLDIEQHELLLLIAVAHKCMQLKRTIESKRINHRRRSCVGHTVLMDLVQPVAHYSLCWKYISDISVLHRLVVH